MAKSTGAASSTKKNNELAVIGADNIPGIIQLLEAKIESLKFIETSSFKTSGTVDGFSNNIKNETLIPNLIRMYSIVRAKEKAYTEAGEDLGLKEFPQFNMNGGTVEDFKSDIQLRIAIIQQKETMDKLKYFREQAKSFISEDEKKAMFFDEMAKFLKGNNNLG